MKIYTPQITNDHATILACSHSGEEVQSRFNTAPLLSKWEVLDFEFKKFNKSRGKIPDLWLLNGGLALRADLKDAVFPEPNISLELLPIKVSGNEWLVVNCLSEVDKYDRENSVLYRGLDGKVFMVIYLVAPSSSIPQSEIFLIGDSNKTNLFLLSSFVERVAGLGLTGLTFKESGVFRDILLSDSAANV